MGLLSAVKGGFEPPVPFLARMFSKHVVSATHPPLQIGFVVAMVDEVGFEPTTPRLSAECSHRTELHVHVGGPARI